MIWPAKNAKRLGRRLVEEAAKSGRYPLLMLPSTDAAFHLVAACVELGMPLRAIGNPRLVESWGSVIALGVMTPLFLWRAVKAEAKLPFAVVVFEDQLVSIDESYLCIEFDGQTYMVSFVEVMLFMKFKPPAYIGSAHSPRQRRLAGLTLTRYTPYVPSVMSRQAAKEIMRDVLRPLLACLQDESISWYARSSFALKKNENFNFVLIQQIQEMESLVRLYSAQHARTMVPTSWFEVLRSSRQEIARQLRRNGQ